MAVRISCLHAIPISAVGGVEEGPSISPMHRLLVCEEPVNL